MKFIKINKKNISHKQSRSTFSIKKRKDEQFFDTYKNKNNREYSTLEKMKKIQKKINIKKIDNKNNKNNKRSLTKNNSHAKLTINNNSALYNFQNLFNKTFNNFNENINSIEFIIFEILG